MNSPSTLIDLLSARTDEGKDQSAFTFLVGDDATGESITYGELDRRSRAIACLLAQHEKPGARIVLLYPPGLDYIAAFFGCMYGGFVAVPAYPPDPSRLNRTLPRLQAIVNDAEANIVLTTSPILAMTEGLIAFAPDLGSKRWFATDTLDAGLEDTWRRPDVTPSSLAFLQYTSGSTGTPKGVMLTHGNLLANEKMITDVFQLSRASVGVGWLPLYHDMGLIGNVLQPIYTGFHCVLMSPLDFLQKPRRWLQAISRFKGTASGGPNFAYELCLRKISSEDRATLDLSSWTLAFCGAEPVRASTLARFGEMFASCNFKSESFLPCYGLAEASLLVTGKEMGKPYRVAHLEPTSLESGRAVEVSAGDATARPFVANGRAIKGTQVLIVDPVEKRPCTSGQVGEIWVQGPHVAIGYWNDPAKTEATFGGTLAIGGAPFLRTGDLGFMLDGHLFISARLKDLIIVRGRNYYPQDIERVVEESYPTLRRGCSAAFSVQVEGEEQLVVAVEIERRVRTSDRRASAPPGADGGERRSTSDRRDPRAELLPQLDADGRAPFRPEEVFDAIKAAVAEHFGLRAHTVVLLKGGSLPKTSSGKVQRHACRAGFLDNSLDVIEGSVASADDGAERVTLAELKAASPAGRRTLLEKYLQGALARLLAIPGSRIDIAQPLNGFGLDSLLAVELTHEIERTFDVVLPATAFLRDGTARDLVTLIMSKMTTASSPPRMMDSLPPPSVYSERPEFSLASGQQALLYLHGLAPQSSAYNIGAALSLTGDLSIPTLQEAFKTLLGRHPALHTTYHEVKGRPVQQVERELVDRFAIDVVDASTWTKDERTERLANAFAVPFDLERGPVFRVAVYTSSATEHAILVGAHHIAADLWSIIMLLSELRTLYPAIRSGRGPDSQASIASTTRYRDFVSWQKVYLAGEAEIDWAFWRDRLIDVPVLDLPTDRPRPPLQTYRGNSQHLAFKPETLARLKEFAHAEGTTIYTVLLTAFEVLLGRTSGQELFLVGSPVVGRPRASYDRVVGYFVNPLPMVADLRSRPTVREVIQRSREMVLGALEQQNFPFPRMVQRLQPARDPSRSPLFQAMFVLEKAYLGDESKITALALGADEGSVDFAGLEVRACPLPQRTAQFDLTLNLAQGPGSLGGALEYNADLFEPATIARMTERFAHLVESMIESPDSDVWALPLLPEKERVQLAEWNATTAPAGSAACLHQVFEAQADRTPDAIAVEDANGRLSYRQLDERANRVARWIESRAGRRVSRVSVSVDRSVDMVAALLGVMKAGAAYVPIDPSYPELRRQFVERDARIDVELTNATLAEAVVYGDGSRPTVPCSGEQTAYVLYTSGSTGQPKGVIVPHRAVVNFLASIARSPGIAPSAVLVAVTTLSFDIAGLELFLPLTVGAKVFIATRDDAGDGERLAKLLATARATIFQATPATYQMLASTGWRAPSSIKLLCGGEAVPPDLVAAVSSDGAEMWNLYGPTETTIWSTIMRVDGARPVRIGRPIANTTVHVLDARGERVPIGVPGELHIGGTGVAHGYFGRPDLTAEKFVPDPFAHDAGARMYATGDLARWMSDGSLEFMGRLDHQVKVRGFRIELAEIEIALTACDGIARGVVVAREDTPGEKRLVAYVVPRVPGTFDSRSVDVVLRKSLPDYMVPSVFVALEAFPMTPNGKIDRKALPKPELSAGASDYVAPRNDTELALCAIMREILEVERVGIDDNFFALGGHSLLATQIVSRIRTRLKATLDVRALLLHPTPRSLYEAFFAGVSEGEL